MSPLQMEERKVVNRIPKVKVLQIEQETVIVIDPLTKRANVYSCVPSMVNKLYEYAEREDVKIDLDNEYGLAIDVPMNWIKIRPPVKRQLTDEQRATLSERMKNVKKGTKI